MRLPRHPATLATAGIVVVHFTLVFWWVFTSFATVDETAHLGSGLAHWRTGNMRPYCVNPPLPRMIATLPTWAAEPHLAITIDESPGARSEWQMAIALARDNPNRYVALMRQARLANLVWAMLAIAVLWRWSAELYGPWGRLIVVSLWCFDPTVLAFSGTVVPDQPAAASGLLACYVFWRYLRAPGWYSSWMAGLGLGLALSTKTTWLVLFLVWPFLITLGKWRPLTTAGVKNPRIPALSPEAWERENELRPRFAHLFLTAAAGWLVLCTVYGFDKFGRPLGRFEFVSHALAGPDAHPGDPSARPIPGNRFRDTALANVPVPLPADLIVGIDIQKYDFERNVYSYLNSEWRQRGWWYYYLYAMALKLAVPAIFLLLGGMFWCLFAPRSADRLDGWAFLLPAVAVLTLVSSQTGLNHHMRYVLPAFPLLFLSAGRLADLAARQKWLRVIVAGALICCASAAASVAPHFMSYFNPLGGGPDNGWRHLVDSNIDWGQDLLYLKKWIDEHPEARPIGVKYFNTVQPNNLGLEVEQVPTEPRPGYYAVSVNYLAGSTFPSGARPRAGMPGPYAYFQHFTPIARAGYSIYIYRITPDDADRVRAEMGLPPWSAGSP